MRIINDLSPITVSSDARRTIDAVVRVRGVDATAGGRGVRAEQHTPVAIIVRDEHGVRRIALPQHSSHTLAFLAAPVAAFALIRAMKWRQR